MTGSSRTLTPLCRFYAFFISGRTSWGGKKIATDSESRWNFLQKTLFTCHIKTRHHRFIKPQNREHYLWPTLYISLIVFSRAFNICFYFFNLTNCSVPARTWKMVKILFFLSKSHFRAHTFYTNTCAYNNTRVGDKKYKKLHVLYYQLLRDSWSYWKIKNRYQKPKLWRIKQL